MMAEATGSVDFSGTWKHDRSENLDGFFKEMGMNFLIRKMATQTNPSQIIEQDGDKFTIHLQTGIMNKTSTFTVGEEFQEKTMGGTDAKCKAWWEDGKLLINSGPLDKNGKTLKVSREIVDDEMVQIFEVRDVICKRYFKRS